MKQLLLIFITLILLTPNHSISQSKGAVTAGAIGALVGIGAGIGAVEQMKERAELTATEWLLANNPEMTSFSLKTLDFDGKKIKDMSSTSVITFKIQEFSPMDEPELNGKKFVLLGFTSHGWINEYGIDFDKIKWFLIDKTKWIDMMVSYVKVASGEPNRSHIEQTLLNGKIVNKGVKIKSKLTIPFYKLSGDMYVATDYSDEMKFIYNERSLGIFLKATKDLVQIGRGSLIELHEFFFDKE
ncbi:hypothetical protein KO500_02475 [Cellulophaga baltica]|uniref:hypothetical protein n=1 Tax=Cellulophaga TaxID=104264 RepID=UPI001C07B39A|nr:MULTISPECIES: hypothetical protein [Cellulophaga]MBU2995276.1 hypothetical protein [Cellulophaga baltica]MDO6766671.1 hypothetical protein [Cellulophaga sp. 1_MG-2023]